jgi:hypothetical protein
VPEKRSSATEIGDEFVDIRSEVFDLFSVLGFCGIKKCVVCLVGECWSVVVFFRNQMRNVNVLCESTHSPLLLVRVSYRA